MEILKKYFPYSFKEKKDVAALVVNIIIYVVAAFVAGVLMAILSFIPFIGLIIGILGSVVELYVTIGIVLSILDYLKVLK